MLPRLRPTLGCLAKPFQFRPLSSTAARQQDIKDETERLGEMITSRSALSGVYPKTATEGLIDTKSAQQGFSPETVWQKEPYHLNVYSTKHNCHIAFTDPKKNIILSLSCGNLGFKKAARGKYDAAYQLAAKVFKTLQDDMRIRPHSIELVLRGFGQGREAVVKALMGSEGRNFKNQVVRVTDSTRLKFGGTRSKKPRRLG